MFKMLTRGDIEERLKIKMIERGLLTEPCL